MQIKQNKLSSSIGIYLWDLKAHIKKQNQFAINSALAYLLKRLQMYFKENTYWNIRLKGLHKLIDWEMPCQGGAPGGGLGKNCWHTKYWILTKFQNFNQISEFWPNFRISEIYLPLQLLILRKDLQNRMAVISFLLFFFALLLVLLLQLFNFPTR